MKKFIDFASESAPFLIIGLVFAVTIMSLISLVLVDVITGQIAGDYLSGDKYFGLFTSLAGTGMLIACGVLISNLWEQGKHGGAFVVIAIFLVLQAADVYFDGIAVDIKRYGYIISTTDLAKPEATAHNIYRFFVAGISFVGEPLGIGSLVAFPLLKTWLTGILKVGDRQQQNRPNFPKPQNFQNKPYQPQHKPQFKPSSAHPASSQGREVTPGVMTGAEFFKNKQQYHQIGEE